MFILGQNALNMELSFVFILIDQSEANESSSDNHCFLCVFQARFMVEECPDGTNIINCDGVGMKAVSAVSMEH